MPNGFVSFADVEKKTAATAPAGFVAFDPSQAAPVVGRDQTAAPDQPAGEVETNAPGFVSDVKRGVGNIIGSTGSTMRDLGMPKLGLDVENYGQGIVDRNPSEVNSVDDIIHKPGTTVREAVGEAAPQVAVTGGSAAAGALIGGGIGSVVPGLGTAVGAAIGGGLGAFAPNAVQEYGGIRQSQRAKGVDDKLGAAAGAGAAASIDMLGPEASIPRKLGINIVKKGATEAGEGILKRTAKGALTEGVTEAVQTGIERVAGHDPLTGKDALDDYAVSGVKGAAGGGVIAGAMGGAKHKGATDPEAGVPGAAAPIDTTQPHDLLTGPRNPGDQQLDLFPDAPETSPVVGTIRKAAEKYGVDPTTLTTIARIESNLDPSAQNPKSSAGGLFQFVDKTAGLYGLTDKMDPAASADAAARMTAESQAYLSKRLKRTPEPWELYLAHQQGPGGAARLLQNPDAPVTSILGEDAIVNNGGTVDMTAGEFANIWKDKFEKAGGGRAVIDSANQPGVRAAGYDPNSPDEQALTDFSQKAILQTIRGEGKATSEVVKLSKGLADALKEGDTTSAQQMLEDVQAKLDKGLDALDAKQQELDAARGDHTTLEHKKYQAEIDTSLDKLMERQNQVAAGLNVLRAYADQNAQQGELDLQPPEPAGGYLELTQPEVDNTPITEPAMPAPTALTPNREPRNGDLFAPEVQSPTLFGDPDAPVAQPAAQTLLAENAAHSRAEESVRNGLLQAVLKDPATRNPQARFIAQLKRAGRDIAITPEEQDAIDAHNEMLDTQRQANAERAVGEDTTLGVPERRPQEPQRQPTVIQPRAQPEKFERPLELRQQTQADLDRLNAADAKRERKPAAPDSTPAGPANGDLFAEDNVRRRADAHAETLGSSRREWFKKGVASVLDGQESTPEGKSRTNWYKEGQDFARREQDEQRVDKGEAPAERTPEPAATPEAPKNTADDMATFSTRLEYELENKGILPKDYQQLNVLAEQGNTPVAELDKMLDAAVAQRQAIRKKFVEGKAKVASKPRSAFLETDEMARTLQRELDKLGLHEIGLKLSNLVTMKVRTGGDTLGEWRAELDELGNIERIIEIAMDSGDTMNTLHHEAIHAMRELGIFTEGEWRAMAKAVSNSPWMDWANDNYPDLDKAGRFEEAIAQAYADWRTDRQAAPLLTKIFRKIQAVMSAIKRVFVQGGYRTAEDIFKLVESGEIGRRGRGISRMEGKLEPAFKAQRPRPKLPEPLQAPATSIKENLAEVAAKGHLWLSFTEDVANMAAKFLPSAKRFIELNSRSHALSRRFEDQLADIKRAYEAVPPAFKGLGKGTVNNYLYTSRMTQAWGFQPSYLKQVKIDPEMKAMFDALPKAAQDVVKRIYRFNYDARRELLTATVSTVNAEFDPLIAAATDQKEKDALTRRKTDALANFSRLHAASDNLPYSPLKRSGNWVVVGMSKEYAEAKAAGDNKTMDKLRPDAAHYWVNFYDTRGEAAAAAKRVGTKFADVQHFERTQVTDAEIGGKELYVAFGELRSKIAAQLTNDPNDEATKQLYRLATDLYLHSLSDTSARKAELKADLVDARDPVTGEAIDMMKSFVSRGQATTHFVAAMQNSGEIHQALDSMAKEAQQTGGDRVTAERFRNELLWRYVHNLNRQPNRVVDAITRGVSLWNLLLSPAYYLTNATQPHVFSLPMLAGRFGYGKAHAAFAKAYAQLTPIVQDAGVNQRLDMSKVPADVKDVIQYLLDRGRLDAGLAQELGSWEMNGGGVLPSIVNPAARIMRYLPQNIETLNRVVTGMAAYRLAKAGGQSEPAAREYASKVIYDTHGDYSGFNEPRAIAATGNFGKIALQFRKFQVIMASHMARMVHNSLKGATPQEKWVARKSLMFTLAHTTALAGMVGAPGAAILGTVVVKALDMLTGDDKDWDDWEQELAKLLGKKDGQWPSWFQAMLYKGAPYALLNLDLSGRLGLSEMLSPAPYTDIGKATSSRDDLLKTIGQIAGGAAAGIGTKLVDAMGYMNDGDTARALETAAPNGVIQGIMKANRLGSQGVQARNGDTLIPADDIDVGDTISAALGLTSAKLADQSQARSAVFEKDEHYKDETSRMKRRYTTAYRAKDSDAIAKVRTDWQELQDARERQGLKRQPISTLLKAPREQVRRERRTTNGVQYTPQNKKSVEEIAG